MHRFFIAGSAALSLSSTALAHPGHSVPVGHPETVSHYALHPEHWGLAALAAAVLAVIVAVRLTRKPQAAVEAVRRDS